jgi:hypothetical protein
MLGIIANKRGEHALATDYFATAAPNIATMTNFVIVHLAPHTGVVRKAFLPRSNLLAL